MESKNYTAEELESIQHRFDSYCKKVIDGSVRNQVRGYLRYCKNYNAVPLDDEPDILGGVIDDYLFEKIEIKAGDETIYLESYQLAEAVMKIPEFICNTSIMNYAGQGVSLQMDIDNRILYAQSGREGYGKPGTDTP